MSEETSRGSTGPYGTEQDSLPLAGPRRVLRVVAENLRGRRLVLAAAVIAITTAATLRLVLPWGLGRMVDVATGELPGGAGSVWLIGGYMILATVGFAACAGTGLALVGQVFESVLARVRERMLAAGLHTPLWRIEHAGTGDLVSRATADVDQVSAAIRRAMPALSMAVFSLALTVIGLGILDATFLVVVVVTLPVYVVGLRMYLARAPQIYVAERAATARRAHELLGAMRGIDSVHAFGMSGYLSGRVATHSWAIVVWLMRAVTLVGRLWGRFNLAEFLGMSTILILGFYLVEADRLTVGATTTAMLLYLQMFAPIRAVLFVVDDLQAAAASLGRIIGVIGESDRLAARKVTNRPHRSPGTGAVHAEDIVFGYHPGRPVLRGVSFELAAGKRMAVVGSSGAGKSTLASLVSGVHTPDAGRLTVDTSRIAMVAQEVHIFSGSLADDVRMGSAAATDAEIRAALHLVRAEWVEALPDGLNTVVGTQGYELTPMQAQQVALARVVLMNPDLVILDEATAEAGSVGALLLEDGAAAMLAGRSSIVVAHRLSQAESADLVIVLDRGRVVEQGSHAELVAEGGTYAALWSAWARHHPQRVAPDQD